MIGKLLDVLTVGSTVVNVTLLHRFMTGIASIVMLAVVSAFILCAILVGGFTLAFFGLVHYGLDPYAAGITLGILGLVAACAMIVITRARIRFLLELPSNNLSRHGHLLSDVNPIIDAFIEGLKGE